MQVGKSNYDRKSSERTTFFRLGMKDDQRSLILRLAPPLKSMADSGRFAHYLKQHFGYTIKNKKGNDVFQTFVCIERKDRNMNIVDQCPECDENNLRKAEVDAKEAKLKAAGASEADIELQLRPMKQYLREHNLDRKWNLVAKDQNGQWGILTIGHKCYEALLTKIQFLRDKGISMDPLDPEKGVWFHFTRAGTSYNNVVDSVDFVTEQTSPGVLSIKFDQILDPEWAKIEALPDLPTMGRTLTYDQIKMLVASGGEESVVKSVMESGQRRESSPDSVSTVSTKAPTLSVAASAPTGGAAGIIAPPPPAVSDEVAKLQAQIAALQAAQAQLVVAQAKPVETKAVETKAMASSVPQPSASLQTSLSNEVDKFMQSFEDDNG